MYEMDRYVQCSNIGADNLVRNSALVDFLQDCSILHLDNEPTMPPFFEAENCIMFLVSRQLDIIRKPAYHEKLHIKTWCYELKRMYGFRNTIITDEQGEICIISNACGCFMDNATQKPRKAPQELVDKTETLKPYEMEYTSRKIVLPDTQPVIMDRVKICRCHIDMNNHVNNARYIDITDEYLPLEAKIKRIRCEYKIPARVDSMVIPKIFSLENILTVDLTDENGKTFAVVEYTLE